MNKHNNSPLLPKGNYTDREGEELTSPGERNPNPTFPKGMGSKEIKDILLKQLGCKQ